MKKLFFVLFLGLLASTANAESFKIGNKTYTIYKPKHSYNQSYNRSQTYQRKSSGLLHHRNSLSQSYRGRSNMSGPRFSSVSRPGLNLSRRFRSGR
jgi:hypothetical protein